MMSRINKVIWYFSMGLMLILSGYILWQCGFTMTYADNLKNVIQPGRLPFFLFGLGAAAGILFCLFARVLQKMTDRQLKHLAALLFGVVIIGQTAMIFTFRTALRGDQMKVFEAAIELMSSGTIANSSYNVYFSRCSNNIPLALVTYLFVRIFQFLHLPESIWMDCAKVIGTAFLDGGLFFGYLVLKRLKGSKTAVLMLVTAVFNPMVYLLTGVYYSSTISLFFGMGAIYLSVRGKEDGKNKWTCPLLMGIFLGFGFKIRATAFICGIAIAVCAFLSFRTREDVKNGLRRFVITMAGFLLVLGLFSGLHKHYVQADYTDTEYTMLHYVMMGANGNGTYSPTDAAYTQSFEGKEAKLQANKERLLERLEAMGPSGILELMGRKLTITFSDGTDDFYDAFNGALEDAGHLKYLNGSRRDFFVGYCHIYNTMLWMGIFLCVILGFIKRDRSNFVVLLSALGGILFQMIWECGEAYSVPYLILFLMLFAEGLDGVRVSADSLPDRKIIGRGLLGGSLLLILGAALWIGKAFSGVILVSDDYRVRQTTYELDIHASDSVVEQTFTASKPFNEIELFVYNVMKEHNQSIYRVSLLNEKNQLIHSELITGYMLPEYGSAYVQFDTVIPNRETVYKIRIESAKADEKSGLVFPYHSTGIYDLYQGGSLKVDGEQKENCDLAFTVYLRSQSEGI